MPDFQVHHALFPAARFNAIAMSGLTTTDALGLITSTNRFTGAC
jgi:hypothetical protein